MLTVYPAVSWAPRGRARAHEFRRLYRKSGSPSKNMTSDFAPEVAIYPQKTPKNPNSPNRDLDG